MLVSGAGPKCVMKIRNVIHKTANRLFNLPLHYRHILGGFLWLTAAHEVSQDWRFFLKRNHSNMLQISDLWVLCSMRAGWSLLLNYTTQTGGLTAQGRTAEEGEEDRDRWKKEEKSKLCEEANENKGTREREEENARSESEEKWKGLRGIKERKEQEWRRRQGNGWAEEESKEKVKGGGQRMTASKRGNEKDTGKEKRREKLRVEGGKTRIEEGSRKVQSRKGEGRAESKRRGRKERRRGERN